MMNTFDADNALYARLTEPLFLASLALTGGVYKGERPVNSKKEDITINSLGMPNTDVQHGVSNVNIHVPNIVIRNGGVLDNSQTDTARMALLTSLVIEQVREFYNGDYWFKWQQQNMVQSDENEHIVNIRVDFYSENF